MHSRAQESGAQSPQPDSHAVCSAPLEQELVSQALAISWPDYLLNLESLSSVPSTHMPARTVAHVCCAVSVLTVLSMSNDELLIATGIPTARIPPRLFSKTYWGLPLKKKTVGVGTVSLAPSGARPTSHTHSGMGVLLQSFLITKTRSLSKRRCLFLYNIFISVYHLSIYLISNLVM